MKKEIQEYKTLVFDCDGVVLNSNKIKSQAFLEAAKHFGHKTAQALVDYHVTNGGVSRYAKVKYFISDILKLEFDETIYHDILERFALAVKDGLMSCEVAEGLDKLRVQTKKANWLIVSGGDQVELREIFAARGLDKYFDGGIFGSPDNKETILAREIEKHNIHWPALFLGDSKYDYQAAKSFELDFLFLNDWSEMQNYEIWCKNLKVSMKRSIGELLN